MAKTQQKNRVTENIKLGASTLISNDACVTIARTRPWYGAVISAVLAVLVGIVPIAVSQFSLKGEDILSSPTYSLDEGLITFQEALNEKNVSMIINAETDTMTVDDWSPMVTNSETNSWAYYSNAMGRTGFEVFWYEGDAGNFSTYLTDITNGNNPLTGEARFEGEAIGYSFMAFYSKGFYVRRYSSASTSATTISGQYDLIESNFDLKDIASKSLDGTSYEVGYANKGPNNYAKYQESSLASWKEFFNLSYETYKLTSAWSWTGIMAGVYTLFVFFMGLMLFIMTRGKDNPFRVITFWENQKIAYWAAFAPAVVGMLISFFMSSMAMMGFILCFGMRIMWLSMKSLRPQQ